MPVSLLLLNFGSPGILIGRPKDIPDVRAAWFKILSSGSPVPHGFQSVAAPVLDTFKLAQFLAKIAHCFATATLADGFEPMLIDFIRERNAAPRYDLVGGNPDNSAPSDNLHELELHWREFEGVNYAVVRIRLFANLAAPTYLVVAGKLR